MLTIPREKTKCDCLQDLLRILFMRRDELYAVADLLCLPNHASQFRDARPGATGACRGVGLRSESSSLTAVALPWATIDRLEQNSLSRCRENIWQ
jgi:hypothetical protein